MDYDVGRRTRPSAELPGSRLIGREHPHRIEVRSAHLVVLDVEAVPVTRPPESRGIDAIPVRSAASAVGVHRRRQGTDGIEAMLIDASGGKDSGSGAERNGHPFAQTRPEHHLVQAGMKALNAMGR